MASCYRVGFTTKPRDLKISKRCEIQLQRQGHPAYKAWLTDNSMGFQVVESSALKVFKMSIQTLAGLADHYYLAETSGLHNSVGWGPNGLELRGAVKITPQELERINRFMSVAKYSIAVNNCEHFANYVLYGINLSSQQHTWWKALGAEVISRLQPVQGVADNYNSLIAQQISDVLNENLRQAKIKGANQERIDFWKSRGIDAR